MKSQQFINDITTKLITIMERGVNPFENGYMASNTLPYNFTTGQRYTSLNVFLLWFAQQENKYEHNVWLTYQQAKKAGIQVLKGARSTSLSYYSSYQSKTDKDVHYKFLKVFNVFNLAQTDYDLTLLDDTVNETSILTLNPLLDAISEMGVDFTWGGDSPCYKSMQDIIVMPSKSAFTSTEALYATLLHEIAHATGHQTRLDRNLKSRFGTVDYAIEELIAECASTLLQAELGLTADIENHASYLNGWIKCAKKDPNFLFKAMADASKVVEYVLQYLPQKQVGLAEVA